MKASEFAALDVERFRSFVRAHFGLLHEDDKLPQLSEILRRRQAALGLPKTTDYLELLKRERGIDELRILAEELTVNETYFFRNPANFRAFEHLVLEDCLRVRARSRKLRILSAGASSGEEAYTLAIVAREALADRGDWEVQIWGIDVNREVLARARRARYSPWSLRATPEDVRRRYFTKERQDFVLKPEIRGMVTFVEQNLAGALPAFWQGHDFDVVFCRNVLMYFHPEVARRVVATWERALRPGGALFLGHAETLRDLSSAFELCNSHETFYYRKRGGLPQLEPPRPELDEAEEGAGWFSSIQRSTERIALLEGARTKERAEPAGEPLEIPAGGFEDLGPALELLREGRFDSAFSVISSLPARVRETPEAELLRGVLLLETGRAREAESVAERLARVGRLRAGSQHLVSLCRESLGDGEGALRAASLALAADPGFAVARFHLGLLLRKAGDKLGARREFERAIELFGREDAKWLFLFGGGFSREALVQMGQAELRALGGEP